MPESSIDILGLSVGGVTYRHYAHRDPLAFTAIMSLDDVSATACCIRCMHCIQSSPFDVGCGNPARPDDAPLALRQRAYRRIRDKFLSGELVAGMTLSENQLAKELGMSRTPVREAILQMEMEGLLDYAPLSKVRLR